MTNTATRQIDIFRQHAPLVFENITKDQATKAANTDIHHKQYGGSNGWTNCYVVGCVHDEETQGNELNMANWSFYKRSCYRVMK